MANLLACYVGNSNLYWRNKNIACAFVERQTIYDKNINLPGRYPACPSISFANCVMLSIPSSESIKHAIPHVSILRIDSSIILKMTADDFKGFECLTDLYVQNCDIEYLPGNLFKHMPNLEIISFINSKVKYIGEGILNPLRKLKIFCLSNNVNINAFYDILNNQGNVTLQQLREEIKNKCKRKFGLEIEKLRNQNAQVRKSLESQKKEIAELKANEKKNVAEINNLKIKCEKLEKKFQSTLQPYQTVDDEGFKDFTIIIGASEFQVNKIVLTAHSKVLENLIDENPEADSLELKDISEATFKEILNYMNDKSPPSENASMVELFGASCLLKMNPLSEIVAERLMNEINPENAFDVMMICNKYKLQKELQLKAMSEYQKTLLL